MAATRRDLSRHDPEPDVQECSLLADPSGGGLRARAFAQMGVWKEARKAVEDSWNGSPMFPTEALLFEFACGPRS
jgi:hypothetical protein